MLKTILAISGKPGLYKLISQAKNMLIVETVSADKKRVPVYASDKVISLGDIAMYTDAEEVALGEVLESVKKKENGNVTSLDYKKASAEELHAFMAEVLPNYDRDRVHTSDIKKLIQWYNLLVSNGETDFVETEKAAELSRRVVQLDVQFGTGNCLKVNGCIVPATECTFALRQFLFIY